jgi:membrane-associated phospholipid phosphatase
MNKRSGIRQELGERLRAELGLKLALTIVLNLCFYVPYGLLQRHQLFTPTQVQPGFLDNVFPFFDRAVWGYFSLFLLMPIGPLLMRRGEQLLRYGTGMLFIEFVAYLIFFFWPTWCSRPDASKTIAAYRVLTAVDSPLNAFPSLHAAFAFFSALCAAQVFRELQIHRLWIFGLGVWTVLILLGTLLTKQHTVADMFAGSAIGLVGYYLVFSRQTAAFKVKLSESAVKEREIQSSSTAL